MDWRDHTDDTGQHIIHNHKGGEHFQNVAASILMSVAYRSMKQRLPLQQHAMLDSVWRQASYGPHESPLHKAKHHLHGEIAAIIDTVDHAFGGYGASGSAWMDAKVRHVMAVAASLFSQNR